MLQDFRLSRRVPPLVSGLALALAVGAATLSPSPAMAGKANNTLTFALDQEVEAVNFYQSTSRDALILSRLIWDTLIYRDPVHGEYKPALATSWKWVNPTILDLDLRKGVTFQNGEPFDADDVVFTINYFSSPEAKLKNSSVISWIDHAEKLGDYQVRLVLKKPFPAALEYLSSPLPIYPSEYTKKVGQEGMEAHPIGTGPYKVTEIVKGQSMSFARNDHYWKESPKGQPQIAKLVMRTIPDKNTQLAELMTGGIDWIWKVEKDQSDALRSAPNLTVKDAETMRIGYLTFDAAGKAGASPLNKIEVRQAISHAINRKAIVDHLIAGGARVVHSACFPEQFGCDQTIKRYDFDVAKAKELLKTAGYPNGFSITLDGYRDRELAEAMVSDLARVGIKTNLNFGKYAAIRDAIRSGKSQMAFMTWGSNSIGDISASTGVFFKGDAEDTYNDAEVKADLTNGDTQTDPAARKEAYSKALRRIADQAYWLPLWSYPYTYAYTSELNFTPTSDEIPHFAQASWK